MKNISVETLRGDSSNRRLNQYATFIEPWNAAEKEKKTKSLMNTVKN